MFDKCTVEPVIVDPFDDIGIDSLFKLDCWNVAAERQPAVLCTDKRVLRAFVTKCALWED